MGDHNDHDEPIDPDDEMEADPPTGDDRDPDDTLPEGVEFLGFYSSIAGYLRAMLEPEVSAGCAWLLDHVDYEAVQKRWERDGSRLVLDHGHVYRIAVKRPV